MEMKEQLKKSLVLENNNVEEEIPINVRYGGIEDDC